MKKMEDESNDVEIIQNPNLGLNDLLEQVEDLPTVLFACNIHQSVFENDLNKENFEQKFEAFGPADFVYLPSFRRVRINYETPQEATNAKISLHNETFLGLTIEVYFAQADGSDQSSSSKTLLPPKADKQFLISPPASPPVGWEPIEENQPTLNYDLISGIMELKPGQSHVLHTGTDTTPSVFVHICERSSQLDSNSANKPKIQHTRRP